MNHWIKNGIGIVIFLSLLLAVFAALQPVYRAISGTIHDYEGQLMELLADKTGLGVSYERLSPSILTGIRLSGITVYDQEGGEVLLTVRRAVIDYSLAALLRKDWDNAFSALTLTDVDFAFDRGRDAAVIEKLRSLGGEGKKKKERPEGTLVSREAIETFQQVLFSLPFDIQARNITASYTDDRFAAQAGISRLDFAKNGGARSISGVARGEALVTLKQRGGVSAGFTFRLDGNLPAVISGSSVIVSLGRHARADYTVNGMEFLVRYSEPEVVLRSTQTLYPYDLYASLDLGTGDVSANLVTKGLNPLALVRMPTLPRSAQKLEGTTLTVDASMELNLFTMRYGWQGSGSVYLPPALLGTEEVVSFDASGDAEDVIISSIKASGEALGGEVSGRFNIPRLEPEALVYLDHYRLPHNGGIISADTIFIAPLNPMDGSMEVAAPQLYLDDITITSAQVQLFPARRWKSLDFTASVSDYSHIDYGDAGKVTLSGSMTLGTRKDMQGTLEASDLFADTVAKVIAFFSRDYVQEKLEPVIPQLAPYVMRTQLYAETSVLSFKDLKDYKNLDVAYNSPLTVLADTRKSSEALQLSFDGSTRNVQVSWFELMYAGQLVQATADADISYPDNQVVFSTAFNLNHIPYQFNGVLAVGEWLNVTGNYGLEVTLNFDSPLNGTVELSNFPLAINDNDYLLSLSTDTFFDYSREDGFHVYISNLQAEELSGKFPFDPVVSFSGRVDGTGFVVESLTYTDNVAATLDGSGYLLWNIDGGVFDSLTFDFSVAGRESPEQLVLRGNFANPLHRPLDVRHLRNDFYFSAEALVTAFPVGRLLSGQQDDDTLNGSVSASGTLENPYLTLNVDAFSMQLSGQPLIVRGNAAYVEGFLNVPELDVRWGNTVQVRDIMASFDVNAFEGELQSKVSASMNGTEMSLPLAISVYRDEGDVSTSLIPESFTVNLDSAGLEGGILEEPLPLHFVLNKAPGMTIVTSDENLGINGYFLDDGTLSMMIDKRKPLHFNVNGSVRQSELNLAFTNVYVDVPRFASFINTPQFALNRGVVSGRMKVTGLVSDPAVEGLLRVSNLDFSLPGIIPDHVTSRRIDLSLTQEGITMAPATLAVKDERISARAQVELDRWSVDRVAASLATTSKRGVPIDVDVPLLRVKGNTSVVADLEYTKDRTVNVTGTVTLRNSEITVIDDLTKLDFSTLASYTEAKPASEESSPYNLNVDMNLEVEQKVSIVINPLLRGLIAPRTPIHVTLDTANELWSVDGDIQLRGGEVFYLSRNFYLKEGRIILNEDQSSFDPYVTVRAETREHDDDGEPVTITLSAIRQNVSRFNPTLYSTPAKSENEIMSILGQIATGDSSSALDMGGNLVDFALQALFFRKLENALRDLCNFDIFSIRLPVLQNAVKKSFGSDGSNGGNYLDGSAVYIGKYFGSSVYADALMQWSYDSSASDDLNPTENSLTFQPEIGIEFMAPFANIRWQFAPDLGTLGNSWVSATSITLSWRVTF